MKETIITFSNIVTFKEVNSPTGMVSEVYLNDNYIMDIEPRDKENFANSLSNLLTTYKIHRAKKTTD